MSGGKRAAARPKKRFRPALLGLALAITGCLVAWGYLVYVAIDFGSKARRGDDGSAWLYLTIAAVGAVACLFLGFLLIARPSRAIGLTSPPEPPADPTPSGDGAGGRRAAR